MQWWNSLGLLKNFDGLECCGNNALKSLSVVFLTVLVSFSASGCAGREKHLFILSGQSNMSYFNPSDTFTPAVIKEFGKENVVVIKDAEPGKPIRRWYKKWKPAQGDLPKATGDLYDRLMTKVYAATKDNRFKTITFIWMQGERDAREKLGNVYAESLKGLIDQLEHDLGRNDVSVVIGRISDFDLRDEKYPDWTMVRQAQVEVADDLPLSAWVDTDDLNDGENAHGKSIKNNLHYSIKGYKILGERFAQKAIELIRETERESKSGNGWLSQPMPNEN